VDYDHTFEVSPFKITYRNAGHILGSASIEISDISNPAQVAVFSGDLGNTPQDIIEPTEYIAKASSVIIESTYGDKTHPVEDVPAIIKKEINEIEQNSGTLIIPSFSIERTQELIHRIGHLKTTGDIAIDTPVFLDSPMAIEVTKIFEKFPQLYNQELKFDHHPFQFPGLVLTKKPEQSKAIREVYGPKVIIAGSGMMNGGRVLHHLRNYIGNPTTRILIVGYQAEDTLGAQIEAGVKQIEIDGIKLPVLATITKIESLSSHADQPRLINWLKQIADIKAVFVVHGESTARSVFAEKLKADMHIQNVFTPSLNEELPVM
jgi:metallo-beta-lactamase family protein